MEEEGKCGCLVSLAAMGLLGVVVTVPARPLQLGNVVCEHLLSLTHFLNGFEALVTTKPHSEVTEGGPKPTRERVGGES